jgi:hypothetical protein
MINIFQGMNLKNTGFKKTPAKNSSLLTAIELTSLAYVHHEAAQRRQPIPRSKVREIYGILSTV